MTPKVEEQLRESFQKSGEVFSKERMEQFPKKNKAVLPPDMALDQDFSIRRDVYAGMIDLVFDFRACPGAGGQFTQHY